MEVVPVVMEVLERYGLQAVLSLFIGFLYYKSTTERTAAFNELIKKATEDKYFELSGTIEINKNEKDAKYFLVINPKSKS